MLSVITPVYNCARFIERSYYCLAAQTFQDWEWVVVNDGSTDDFAQTIARIDDPRVRVLGYTENKGRGHARQYALDAARGDWIVLWDVDDLYFPDRLAHADEARKRGFDFSCSYTVVVDNQLRFKGVRGYLDDGWLRYFVHHTLACRTDVARRIGYVPKYRVGEDYSIMMVLSGNYRGEFIEDALCVYQEDREVNLPKAIVSNLSQFEQFRDLYRRGEITLSQRKYYLTVVKWTMKIMVLNLLRLVPSLYRSTIRRRSYGTTAPEWILSSERREFIERVKVATQTSRTF